MGGRTALHHLVSTLLFSPVLPAIDERNGDSRVRRTQRVQVVRLAGAPLVGQATGSRLGPRPLNPIDLGLCGGAQFGPLILDQFEDGQRIEAAQPGPICRHSSNERIRMLC
jgi:hypothetical protein